jgi:hypothetical protein
MEDIEESDEEIPEKESEFGFSKKRKYNKDYAIYGELGNFSSSDEEDFGKHSSFSTKVLGFVQGETLDLNKEKPTIVKEAPPK